MLLNCILLKATKWKDYMSLWNKKWNDSPSNIKNKWGIFILESQLYFQVKKYEIVFKYMILYTAISKDMLLT